LRWRWGPKYVQKPNIFLKNIKKCYHIFPECLITSGYYKIISVHFEAVFKTKKATLAVCRSKIRERQLSISTKYQNKLILVAILALNYRHTGYQNLIKWGKMQAMTVSSIMQFI
jgi:hypothetical protein